MAKVPLRPLVILCGLTCAASALPAQAQQAQPVLRVVRPVAAQETAASREVTPPPTVSAPPPTSAVTLKQGATEDMIKTLVVRQRVPLATLRAKPVVALGKAKLDLRPVFDNPAALINFAARLKQQPALVRVSAENAEMLQIDKGLLVRQFVAYRIASGTCSNPGRRQQLERSGGSCATRLAPAARATAFADPADPHYVTDPRKRAQVIANANEQAAKQQADLAEGIADFRAKLANPVQRAQIEAQLGAAEAQRLAALSDDDLAAEMVNTAEVQVEDTMFVPTADKLDLTPQLNLRQSEPSTLHMPPEKVDVDHTLRDHILLTGFTLGRQEEWRRRVSITINACIVSCKKTYYAEVYAGFGYGLGLRFPIKVGGLYSYHRNGPTETASIAPAFVPIDGSPDDYSSTGLDSDKIFRGQELVAELDAYAGMNFKVPFYSDGVEAKVGANLADELPAPFTHGQFTPPVPGAANAPEIPVVFDNPDLLAGFANYGVVGAKVLPAVKIALVSNFLRLRLKDDLSGKVTEMESSGQTYPLAVNPQDHTSRFTIGNPEYNLAFQITPGLAARLFIDVAVWSDHWDWPVWFPQIAVTLPPGGATFTCHEKTVCSYDYLYSPTDEKDKQGNLQPPDDLLEREVYNWQVSFQKKWFAICPSMPLQFCQVAILGVVKTIGNQMESEMKAQPKYPSNETAMIVLKKAIEADKQAKAIVLENKVALIDRHGKELFKTYEPFWNSGCADQLCRDNIKKLGGQYVRALMDRQKANPDKEQNEIVLIVNTAGHWAQKAHDEVEASKRRVGRSQPSQRVIQPGGVRLSPGGT